MTAALCMLVASSTAYVLPSLLRPVDVCGVATRAAAAHISMEESEWEKYLAQRGMADVEKAEAEYRTFKGIDQEFDGGDSGGGVVGDGNTDLEDQHNSATLGALRGGIADYTGATLNVGRGNVKTLDDDYSALNEGDEFGDASSSRQATNARTAAAGKNYFGRSTGLADKLMDSITDDDVKTGKMDAVRAQQKENWFNQRAIHASNRAQGQGVVFGDTTEGKPREGGYVARDAQSKATGAKELEISQHDLANHLQNLASLPAERLDGQEWGELFITDADPITQTFEVRASPRQTSVTDIPVSNDYNTFAPYRCHLLPTSSSAFSVSPNHGSMNRRSGEPVGVVVRYSPQESGVVHEGIVVFETEDMKKIFKFIGST